MSYAEIAIIIVCASLLLGIVMGLGLFFFAVVVPDWRDRRRQKKAKGRQA